MPAPLADAGIFQALLDVSLTALALLRPLYGPGRDELTDFAFDYLNPAGQRMLGLPERPETSFLTSFSYAREPGALAFYRRVFETGEAGTFEGNYPSDGLTTSFQVAASRQGPRLAVSFVDTLGQPRGLPGTVLPTTQTADAATRSERVAQQPPFFEVLLQVPAQIATHRGPDHVFTFVNPHYQRYFSGQDLLGRPLLEVRPEAGEQGLLARLDHVYQTGETYRDEALAVKLDVAHTGQLQLVYLDVCYSPLRDAQGRICGVLNFSYDVTAQVLARQQAHHQVQVLSTQLRVLSREMEERVERQTMALQVHARDVRANAEQEHASLTRFLNKTHAAICVLRGPAQVLDYCNPAFERLFSGQPLPAGRPLAEVFPGVVTQELVATLDGVYRTGVSFLGVEQALALAPAVDQPTHPRYFTFSFDAYQEHGRTVGVSFFAYDVTEAVLARRQNEALQAEALAAAQRQAQERATFHEVFEQTSAAICLLREPGHRIEYANPAYQQLFAGRPLRGRTVAESQPEAVAQGFVALLDGVFQTGTTHFGSEMPLTVAAPGDAPAYTRYFDFTYQAYRENGEMAGVSVFAYDVTERVRARAEAEAQRQQLERLFRQAPANICIFAGPELTFEFVNPGYQRLFPDRQLLGRPLLVALPEMAAHRIYEELRWVYETGRPHEVQNLLVPIARPGEGALEDRYFNYIQQPRYNEQGQIDGVVAFAYETTAQVRASQQIQALNTELTTANQQLTRTNTDLDTFIYTASHDLRTPIGNIEGLLAALSEELPAEALQAGAVQPLLDRMQRSVERFQLTIAQLTDVAQLQRVPDQPAETVDLAALVKHLRFDLATDLATPGATLAVEVAACPHVSFAPQHLRSIVYNLLSNALKYRHPTRPPIVELRCRRTNDAVVLEVQDNGLGLTEGQQSQLFGLFQRLHDHVPGTGIGLYMVKRLVENAGGTIAVQSQVGVGTTFTVTLPSTG
ncbi:MAG: PAS domain-containing protein [Janthinobacterium lividum]